MWRHILLIFLYKGLVPVILWLITGLRYHHRRVLRQLPPCILVANHNSHLDTLALLAAMPWRKLCRLHPVAAADYFGASPRQARRARFWLNALLICRKGESPDKEEDPVAAMSELLARGDSLLIFPEGSRGAPDVMLPFKKGIGHLLARFPHIPFVPVYLEGFAQSLPKGSRLPLPYLSRVYFGEPRYVLDRDPGRITQVVERYVKALRARHQLTRLPMGSESVREQVAWS